MKDLFIVRNKTVGTNTCYCTTYAKALECMKRAIELAHADPKCSDWEYDIQESILFE